MVEFVPIPKTKHNWTDILSSIPPGQAAQLHFDRRHKAVLAGEAARSYARNNKLSRLHTHIEGGLVDPSSGVWLDVDCDVTLTIWLTK